MEGENQEEVKSQEEDQNLEFSAADHHDLADSDDTGAVR